jgi:hypothetical protein
MGRAKCHHNVGTTVAVLLAGPQDGAILPINGPAAEFDRPAVDRHALQNLPKEGTDMATLKEKHPHSERKEHHVDEAVEDSFPASDPPSTGGITRLEPDKKKEQEKEEAKRGKH